MPAYLILCRQKNYGDVVLEQIKKIFNKKPFFYSVLVLSLLAVIIRFFELALNVEAQTGFYKNQYSFGRILFITVLVAAFVFGFVWNKLSRRRALLPINMRFDFSAFTSEKFPFLVGTAGFAVNTFYEIYLLSNPLSSLVSVKTTSIFAVLATIFSTACLVYFMFMAFLIENDFVGKSAFGVVMVAWAIFRMLRDFITTSTVFYISKSLLDVLFLCSLLLSTFAYCRLISDTDKAKGYRQFSIFAPITIVLGSALSIPTLLGALFGFEAVSLSDAIMNVANLALSLFLLRFGMHLYKEI